MKENTFTYTARSAAQPEKVATFTFHNGSVSVDLANVLVEQAGKAYDAFSEEESEEGLSAWVKPAATGSLQKMLKPIPLADFDAEVSGDDLQATAWIRAAGLRLAPIMMTWHQVDNPEGAKAFVNELHARKETIVGEDTLFDPFDYWASWIAIGLTTVALPIILIRHWQRRQSS
jgi:hypothetical protein